MLRFQADFYESAHPQAADVYLIIEVSDSTLEYDRTVKAPTYAQAGITEYWIVNLVDDVIEIYSFPMGAGYQQVTRLGRGQSIAIQALPGYMLTVDALLG